LNNDLYVGRNVWLNLTLTQDFHNFFNNPPIPPLVTPRSYSGTDFAWGVGVRLEYEGFDVDSNSANVASLSVFLTL